MDPKTAVNHPVRFMLYPENLQPAQTDANGKPLPKTIPCIIIKLEEVEKKFIELCAAVKLNQPIRPAVLKGGNKNENWHCQQIFGLDFDDGNISVDEMKKRCNSYSLTPNIIYRSPSWTPEIEKHRLLFVLTEPIMKNDVATHIRYALMKIFPEADKSCVNACRYFNTTPWGDEIDYNCSLNQSDEFISRLLKITVDFNVPSELNNSSKKQSLTDRNEEITRIHGFDYELAKQRSKLVNAFFTGYDHTGKHADIKYADLKILATNFNMIEGGLKDMHLIMNKHNDASLTHYKQEDFQLLAEVEARNYRACSFENSNFIEDRHFKSIFDVVKHQFNYQLVHAEDDKRISDIITMEDIKKWKSGDNIFINAGTSLGKTHFIIGSKKDYVYIMPDFENDFDFGLIDRDPNNLAEYAYKNNKKVLFLTNRSLAKNQARDVKKKFDESLIIPQTTVTILTYQYLVYCKNKLKKEVDLTLYDFIVLDECHYFISDISFIEDPITAWKMLNNLSHPHIKIYMTATPDGIRDLLSQRYQLISYDIGVRYSHVDKFICFNKKAYIADVLQRCKQNDTKSLIFMENKKDLIKYMIEYESVSMLMVGNNPDYDPAHREKDQEIIRCIFNNDNDKKKNKCKWDDRYDKKRIFAFVDHQKREKLIQENSFDGNFLFATSVLDCGFNIIDENITDIIVSSRDITKLVQWIGRYRPQSGSTNKIQVHIHNQTSQYIEKSSAYKEIKDLSESTDALKKQYYNLHFGILDGIVNKKFSWLDLMRNRFGENVYSYDYELADKENEVSEQDLIKTLEKYYGKKISGKDEIDKFFEELGITNKYGRIEKKYEKILPRVNKHGYTIKKTNPQNRTTYKICYADD